MLNGSMMLPMRVLMVTREYPPFVVGGVAIHTYYLTKYLKKKGLKVKVVSFGDPKLSNEEVLFIEPNSSIISNKSTNIVEDIKVPMDILRFINKVKAILKNEDYDLVHVQEPYVGGPIAYEHKVTTIHDTSFEEIRGRLKYLGKESLKQVAFYATIGYVMEFLSIASSKVIINPSIDVAWEMLKVYRVPIEKIRVIPNGVEDPQPNEPDKHTARQIIGIPEDCFVILSIARHIPVKRLDILIKTAKILKEKALENFVVIIGGKGTLTDHLKELAKELNVNDVVKFVGWLSKDRLPLYYRAADVFVITSEYESGPLTILEAGIRGLPLVVSDTPSGFIMLARNEVDCIKFKPGDPEDFANKIMLLASDYSLWKELSRGAMKFASLFRWEKIAEKTISVYKEVLTSLD